MSRNYWNIGDRDDGKRVFRERYEHAATHVTGEVVDVACGHGYGAYLLGVQVQDVESIVGIDRDLPAIAEAAKQCSRFLDSPAPRRVLPTYLDADLQTPSGLERVPPCDWIVTLETVEHLPDHLMFLDRCKEVARRGIVLSTPVLPDLTKRPGNFHNFTPDEIDGWFEGWGRKVFSTRLGHANHTNRAMRDCYYLGVYQR